MSKSIVLNENERTLRKIRRELYILYADRLIDETFHPSFVEEIDDYLHKRIEEEQAKMNWFPVVWSDDDVSKEFDVKVSVVVKSDKEITVRLSLKTIKNPV